MGIDSRAAQQPPEQLPPYSYVGDLANFEGPLWDVPGTTLGVSRGPFWGRSGDHFEGILGTTLETSRAGPGQAGTVPPPTEQTDRGGAEAAAAVRPTPPSAEASEASPTAVRPSRDERSESVAKLSGSWRLRFPRATA